MSTLSAATSYATAGLSVVAAQSALVSKNIGFAGDENYSRKTAEVHTLPGGAPAISGITRSIDKQILDRFLASNSLFAESEVLLDALTRIAATVGDPEDDISLAAMLGKFQSSLEIYQSNPSDISLASAALAGAKSLAGGLNAAADALSALRTEADKSMTESVEKINSLLAQFKIVNDGVVRGSGTPDELAENLDLRDAVLKQLSSEIGIRTVTQPNNGILIFAQGGTVLFEGSPRTVSLQPSQPLAPNRAGHSVYIDGVPVTGPSATMPASTGRITALAKIRDDISLNFQNQLDELASGLIRNFAESDQSANPVLPHSAGLFVDPAGGIPVAGSIISGLASRIEINSLADPIRGGNPLLIRDGGFGGSSYVYNRQASASYQARVSQLVSSFDAEISFDPSAQLGSSASAKNFAVNSAGWVEMQRKMSHTALDMAAATRVRANEALLRVTGVSIDQEMASLLDLEKSYQASSKVIAVVDSMLASLLQAVG